MPLFVLTEGWTPRTVDAAENRTAHTIVLALGNPLRGDDGAGAAVVAALRERGVPDGITLVDGGTPGLETALLLQGYRRAIIVDAAEMGREPGAWMRFEREALISGDLAQMGTLHAAGLAEALALAGALDILPGEIAIYGVQPLEIGWQPGLSEPVEAAIPAVAAAILDELSEV